MEIGSKRQERENPSPINSPNSNGSCSNNNSNGSPSSSLVLHNNNIATPPLTPKQPISRSEPNPYPTTFVQADTTTFKQVVQMLTGSSETAKQASKTTPSDPHPLLNNNNTIIHKGGGGGCSIPPIKTGQKKQGFKLYERRNSLKNGLMISPLIPSSSGFPQNSSSFSPRKPEILSPSILGFPSLVLSPVTPLNEDPFNNNNKSSSPSEEEKAIAEKKFYLHPSPRTATPRDSHHEPPQLLPLFPVTSPRVSGSSS